MRVELSLSPFDASWEELADAAGQADEAGVTGIWVMDHLTGAVHGRQHVLECFSVLSGLAVLTHRCRLGSLVANCGLRNPAVLAQSAATVHHKSAERLVLGLGAGGGAGSPYGAEMETVGIGDAPAPVRRARVAETIDVLEHLWEGQEDRIDGDHYQVGSPAGFLRPDPAPTLLVAGFGPKMAALAGRRAHAFNTHARHPELAALTAVVQQSAAAAGRARPETSVFEDFDDVWLDPASTERKALAAAGVDTMIVTMSRPFDPQAIQAIAAAGRQQP